MLLNPAAVLLSSLSVKDLVSDFAARLTKGLHMDNPNWALKKTEASLICSPQQS
jgi:hypothetical protein